MRVHNCSSIGCHNKVPLDKRYCQEHEALHKFKYDKSKVNPRQQRQYFKDYNKNQRDQEANTFYQSAKWQHMRDYVVARDMNTCQICGDVLKDRKIVDHIHPLKYAPDEKLKSNNLQTLCYRCHNLKTSIEKQVEAKPNAKNKLNHISQIWWKTTILRAINEMKSN